MCVCVCVCVCVLFVFSVCMCLCVFVWVWMNNETGRLTSSVCYPPAGVPRCVMIFIYLNPPFDPSVCRFAMYRAVLWEGAQLESSK